MSDAEKLMAEQMKHVEGLGEIPVFDVRKPAEQTLREIADNWQQAEEKAVAMFHDDNPDLTLDATSEAVLRWVIRGLIQDIALGRTRR